MPNLETIRRLKVQATSEGVDKATADVNRLANAQEAVVRTSDTLTRRQISAAGSFDRLKASLDPAFRAQQMYERGQRTLDRALEQGIIEANEYASTIELLRQRQLAMNAGVGQAVPHLNAAAGAVKLNQGQMQNMAYQLNDMSVMLASGQSPFLMIMQQGSQMSQLFAPGTPLMAALKAVGSAIVGFITNPLNLAVLGFAVAAGAAALLFRTISAGRSAEDVLKRHAELVGEIGKAFDRADDSAKHYGASLATFKIRIDEEALRTELDRAMKAVVNDGVNNSWLTGPSLYRSVFAGPAEQQMLGLFDEVRSQLDQGLTPDIIKFQEKLAEIANTNVGDAGAQDLATKLMDAFGNAVKLAQALREVRGLTAPNQLVAGLSQLGAYQLSEDTAMGQAQRVFAAQMQAIGAKSPGQRAAAASAQEAATWDDSESLARRQQRIELAGTLALAQAQRELSEAYQERMRSLNETVAASQLDLELVGKSQREVAALRLQHQLLASLREEAARNGFAIDQAEIEAIRKKADEVGRLAEATARAGLLGDVGFDRAQMGRSSIEQTVADRMRAIYGDGYGDQMQSFEAQQVRVNEQLRVMSDLGKDAVSGFIADIRRGTSVLDALGNALNRVADKLLSMAVDQLWSNAFGGLSGGLSGLLGGGGGLSFGAAIPSGLYHSGGVVGINGASRYVHPAYFDDAPRFHGGGVIGADERPIIAKVGEVVGWPSQMAQAFGGGKMEVHIHPPAGYTATEKRSRTADGGTRLDVAFDEIAAAKAGTRGTALNRAISLSHGGKPQLTGR